MLPPRGRGQSQDEMVSNCRGRSVRRLRQRNADIPRGRVPGVLDGRVVRLAPKPCLAAGAALSMRAPPCCGVTCKNHKLPGRRRTLLALSRLPRAAEPLPVCLRHRRPPTAPSRAASTPTDPACPGPPLCRAEAGPPRVECCPRRDAGESLLCRHATRIARTGSVRRHPGPAGTRARQRARFWQRE